MLIRVFYVSEISPGCTETDVQVILGQAQIRNRRLDVTGMLAKSDGHFCQVLEGRRESVDAVMERVRRDGRHSRVRVLMEQPCEQRLFEGWAMGLVVRDDMAEEMRQLQVAGAIDGVAMPEVVRRLLSPYSGSGDAYAHGAGQG